jgi:chromosome segregation ATPase
MSFVPFLRNFLGAKGHQATDGLTQALVKLDPEAASQADLATMEQDLDRAGIAIQKLRSDLTHEQSEFDHVSQQYHELMGAAELLQKKVDDPATPEDQRNSVKASLAALLDRIEHLVPDLDRDKHDVDATQALLTEAEQAYQDKASALTNAKHNLDRARQDMQHAALEEQRARDRAEQAEVVAGLKTSATSKLTVALDTMQHSAAQARERAAATDMKAKALTGASQAAEDSNVAAALAEVRGTSPTTSLADRLAALKR